MLVVLVLLLLGVLVARLDAVPAGTAAALDRIVILLALPGLVLQEVPRLKPSLDMLVPVAIAWGSVALLVGALLAIGRIRGWAPRTLGTLLVVVPLGNTSFLGIPAITALLGSDHVGPAVVYDQLGSFVALVTWGSFAAASWGGGEQPTASGLARRLTTFPPFLALVAALVLGAGMVPSSVRGPIDDLAGVLADTLVPLTMLSVGMRLRVPATARVLEPLVVGIGLRMLVAPAVALGVMRLLDEGGTIWRASVLECAMPPMVTAAVIATAAGLDEELASALVGVGVLVGMGTLPMWAGWL